MDFTQDQKAKYAIAMLASLGQPKSGPEAATDTLNAIKDGLRTLQDEIGTWSVVWGPALYSYVPTTTPDHIMFVAQQANTNNYAIGIAGTNFSSVIDVFDEDFAVGKTMPWILGGAPSGAAISSGTFLGLSLLLNMTASAKTPQAGVKLVDFLKAESKKGSLNISACGHSLGGALAPTLALFLQNIKNLWDQSGKSTLMTMPVAGPTAGNDIFASYSNATVPTKGFYNSLDLVPHAWAASDLAQLATLYGDSDPLGAALVAILAGIATAMTQSIRYTPTARTELTGTLQPNMNYFKQGGYQHIYAYDVLFFGSVQAELHPPPTKTTAQISASLATAIKNAGGEIPANVEIVSRSTKPVSFGKMTFQVPESADEGPILQALTAIAPYFGAALGA